MKNYISKEVKRKMLKDRKQAEKEQLIKRIEKAVAIDSSGNYLLIGFTEEEIKESISNPDKFQDWVKENHINKTFTGISGVIHI